jgi:hypothetical protein
MYSTILHREAHVFKLSGQASSATANKQRFTNSEFVKDRPYFATGNICCN